MQPIRSARLYFNLHVIIIIIIVISCTSKQNVVTTRIHILVSQLGNKKHNTNRESVKHLICTRL